MHPEKAGERGRIPLDYASLGLEHHLAGATPAGVPVVMRARGASAEFRPLGTEEDRTQPAVADEVVPEPVAGIGGSPKGQLPARQ